MITSGPPNSSPNGPLFGSSATRRSAARVYTRRTATTASSASKRSGGSREAAKTSVEGDSDELTEFDTETEEEEEEPIENKAYPKKLGSAAASKESLTSTPSQTAARAAKKRKLDNKTPSADDVTPTLNRTRSGTLCRAISTPTLGSSIKAKVGPSIERDKEVAVNVLHPSSPTPSDRKPPRTVNQQVAPKTPPSQRIKRTLSTGMSPRNLAQQFSVTAGTPSSPGSASGSPRPRLSRMLTKTQSLGVPSSPSRLREERADIFGSDLSPSAAGSLTPGKLSRTHSLPSTPSRTPGRMRLLDEGEDGLAPSNPLLFQERPPERGSGGTGSGGRARRVYGRSRTMLAEGLSMSPGGDKAQGPDEVVKESYKELRKRYEVDNSGEDIVGDVYAVHLDLLAARNGQSVADLKSKGENRRFMDQLGYLIDPVTDASSSASLRRSSAFNLLGKSQDPEWLDKLKICGQVDKVWEVIHQTRDESGSGVDSILLDSSGDCVELVVGMLKVESGPLDEAYVGKTTGLVSRIRSAYNSVSETWSQKICATRRLASFVLCHLTQDDHCPLCAEALRRSQTLKRVIRSLAAEVALLSDRRDMVNKGLPLLAPSKPADIEHIGQCLQIVSQLVTEGADDLSALSEWDAQTAACFQDALACGLHLVLHVQDVAGAGAHIVCNVLQALAPLVNVSTNWSGLIGDQDILVSLTRVLLFRRQISQAAKSRTDLADDGNPFDVANPTHHAEDKVEALTDETVLCLVLALLTTGVLQHEEVVKGILSTTHSATCTGANSCSDGCSCTEAISLARLLLEVYLSHMEGENEPSGTSGIISSYTALLISKFISAAGPNQQPELLEQLPGSNTQDKLRGLLGRLSELGGLEKWVAKGSKAQVDAGEDSLQSAREDEEVGVVEDVMEELKRTMAQIGDSS